MRHAHIYELADPSFLKAFEKPILKGLLQNEHPTPEDDLTYTKEGYLYYRNKQKYEKGTFPANAQDMAKVIPAIGDLMRHINTQIIAASKETNAPLSDSFRGMFPIPYFPKNPLLLAVYGDSPDTLRHFKLVLNIELPAIVTEKEAQPEEPLIKESSSMVSKGIQSSEPSDTYKHFLQDWSKPKETETTKAPLRNHSITFYVMIKDNKIDIAGMDYAHLPIMREKHKAEVLEIYNPDGVQPGVEYQDGFLYWLGGGAATKWERVEEMNTNAKRSYSFFNNSPEIITHNKFKTSSAWQLIDTIIKDTNAGKEFYNIFRRNTKFDIYFFPAPSVFSIASGAQETISFDKEGYAHASTSRGFTSICSSLKDAQEKMEMRSSYQYFQVDDIKASFENNKEVVVIGLRSGLLSLIENEYLIRNMKNFIFNPPTPPQNTMETTKVITSLVDVSADLMHELWAHGRTILLNIDDTEEKEHEAYFGKKDHYSPSSKEIEFDDLYRNTIAYKNIKQIRNSVIKNYPFND